jgi:hypothetical protein
MLIAKESRPDEETGPGLSCAKRQFAESIWEIKCKLWHVVLSIIIYPGIAYYSIVNNTGIWFYTSIVFFL